MASSSDRTCHSIQLMNGDGNLDLSQLENFCKASKLVECGVSYAVVSIIGPQSSGKSTLLNHLFGTNFRVLDPDVVGCQTTEGIWMGKSTNSEHYTLVIDVEGTDGNQRGEDGVTFEKQSALFALALSDVVLINMWCSSVGLYHGANRPLITIVIQEMMRLIDSRKRTLIFVIRDKSKKPLEKLTAVVKENIQKIFDTIPKLPEHKDIKLSDLFNIEVTALSSYEGNEQLFQQEVAIMRRDFIDRIVFDRKGDVAPASSFPFSTNKIWTTIKANEYLDLPKHKDMVARVCCEDIQKKILSNLEADKDWNTVKKNVKPELSFVIGKMLNSIFKRRLSEYDKKAFYYDESARSARRQTLQDKVLKLLKPVCQRTREQCYSKALGDFKYALENRKENDVDHHAAIKEFEKMIEDLKKNITFDIEIQAAAAIRAKYKEALHKEHMNKKQKFDDAAKCLCSHYVEKFVDECKGLAIAGSDWDAFERVDELKKAMDAHAREIKAENIKKKFGYAIQILSWTVTGINILTLTPPGLETLLSTGLESLVDPIADFLIERGVDHAMECATQIR